MAKNYKVMSRESFLAKRSIKKQFVELENSEGVYIKEMNARGVEHLAELQKKEPLPSNVEVMAIMICMSACDEDGNAIFTLDDSAQIIENISVANLVKLSEVTVKLSGLGNESLNKEIKNIKK